MNQALSQVGKRYASRAQKTDSRDGGNEHFFQPISFCFIDINRPFM